MFICSGPLHKREKTSRTLKLWCCGFTLIKEQNKKIYTCTSLFTSCCSTIHVCVCVSTCCVIGTSVVAIVRVSKWEAWGRAGPDQTRKGIVEASDTFVCVCVCVWWFILLCSLNTMAPPASALKKSFILICIPDWYVISSTLGQTRFSGFSLALHKCIKISIYKRRDDVRDDTLAEVDAPFRMCLIWILASKKVNWEQTTFNLEMWSIKKSVTVNLVSLSRTHKFFLYFLTYWVWWQLKRPFWGHQVKSLGFAWWAPYSGLYNILCAIMSFSQKQQNSQELFYIREAAFSWHDEACDPTS